MIHRLPYTPDRHKLTWRLVSGVQREVKPLQVKREVPSGITPWPWVPLYITHEKYIYSIQATENRKKTRSHPPTPILHPYTDTNNTVAHNKVGHQVPSLENWGGGLKSLLWHANSPHTPSVQTEWYACVHFVPHHHYSSNSMAACQDMLHNSLFMFFWVNVCLVFESMCVYVFWVNVSLCFLSQCVFFLSQCVNVFFLSQCVFFFESMSQCVFFWVNVSLCFWVNVWRGIWLCNCALCLQPLTVSLKASRINLGISQCFIQPLQDSKQIILQHYKLASMGTDYAITWPPQ